MITHPPEYKPSVHIETTNTCNYKCRMCWMRTHEMSEHTEINKNVMPMSMFKQLVTKVVPYCSSISLTGLGEFLMDKLVKERLKFLANILKNHPHIRYFQTTNGSLLTRDAISPLHGIPNAGFTISIDTRDPLQYAYIRRNGHLPNVLDNIRQLRSNMREIGVSDVHIQLNMVLMKSNVFSVPDVIRFAKEINARLFIDHVQCPGIDLSRESLFHFPAFANNFLGMCKELARAMNVDFDQPPPFAILPHEVEQYYESKKDALLYCEQLSARGPLRIGLHGDVWGCCQNLIFGNLNQSPFEEIFFSPRFEEHRSAIAGGNPLPPCDHCRWLQRAAPYLYESSDYDFDIPPETRCLDQYPNLDREGFVEWLDLLSESQLRIHLRENYLYQWERIYSEDLVKELDHKKKDMDFLNNVATWIKDQCRVMMYPAGRHARWALCNTLISKLNIIGLSDKNESLHDTYVHGHKVYRPSQIADIKPDIMIIASNIYADEIVDELSYLKTAGIKLEVMP